MYENIVKKNKRKMKRTKTKQKKQNEKNGRAKSQRYQSVNCLLLKNIALAQTVLVNNMISSDFDVNFFSLSLLLSLSLSLSLPSKRMS